MKPEINFKKLLKKVMAYGLGNNPKAEQYPDKPGICGLTQEEIAYLRGLQNKIEQKGKQPQAKKQAKVPKGNASASVSTDFASPGDSLPVCPTAE